MPGTVVLLPVEDQPWHKAGPKPTGCPHTVPPGYCSWCWGQARVWDPPASSARCQRHHRATREVMDGYRMRK